jgi:hypothetical protein
MQSVVCAAQPRGIFVAKREARATSIRPEDDRASPNAGDFVGAATPSKSTAAFVELCAAGYLMWTPEIALEMTRRWISEVPSKIV